MVHQKKALKWVIVVVIIIFLASTMLMTLPFVKETSQVEPSQIEPSLEGNAESIESLDSSEEEISLDETSL